MSEIDYSTVTAHIKDGAVVEQWIENGEYRCDIVCRRQIDQIANRLVIFYCGYVVIPTRFEYEVVEHGGRSVFSNIDTHFKEGVSYLEADGKFLVAGFTCRWDGHREVANDINYIRTNTANLGLQVKRAMVLNDAMLLQIRGWL